MKHPIARITSKAQTTISRAVREFLNVGPRPQAVHSGEAVSRWKF